MKEEDVKKFTRLRVWTSGDNRAPYKPLMVLWFIARCLAGKHRLVSFEEVEVNYVNLIRQFGPHRKSANRASLPFWHLRNDGIWEIDRPSLVRQTSKGDAYVSDLRRHGIEAGILPEYYKALRDCPEAALSIVEELLASHFPSSLHQDILDAIEFPRDESLTSRTIAIRRRDPMFRKSVLAAYQYRCGVCEISLSIAGRTVGLEAAHIRWHSAAGSEEINNGLSLCNLHHVIFDSGGFTLLPDLTLIISKDMRGTGLRRTLGQYEGAQLAVIPERNVHRPSTKHLMWHHREVFRNPNLLA